MGRRAFGQCRCRSAVQGGQGVSPSGVGPARRSRGGRPQIGAAAPPRRRTAAPAATRAPQSAGPGTRRRSPARGRAASCGACGGGTAPRRRQAPVGRVRHTTTKPTPGNVQKNGQKDPKSSWVGILQNFIVGKSPNTTASLAIFGPNFFRQTPGGKCPQPGWLEKCAAWTP